MIYERHRHFYRCTSAIVLFFCLPMFLGIGPWVEARAHAQATDMENSAYELAVSADIAQLARSLDDRPMSLYEWVRKEIRYEPYPGGAKGAIGAYRSRAGNTIDKAALLGALLTHANATWRFAVGTARLTPQLALGWLGVGTIPQATALLDAAGCEYEWVGPASDPEALLLRDHVWIELYGAYLPLRGASIDDLTTGPLAPNPAIPRERMWVPLDPTITARPLPGNAGIQQRLGVESPRLWETIKKDSHTTQSGEGVTGVPAAVIRGSVLNAVSALRQHLKTENRVVDQWLETSGPLIQAPRQVLPGNLPYEVVGGVKTYDASKAEELIDLLRARRRVLGLRIVDEAGTYKSVWTRVGVPRLGPQMLAVQFLPKTSGDASTIMSYAENNSQVVRTLASVRPAVTLDGYDLLGGNQPGFNLGSPLRLEIQDGGGAVQEIRILAGGFYVIKADGSISGDVAAQWKKDVSNLYDLAGQGQAGNYLQATTHEAVLGQWLGVAAETILGLAERFSRVGSAALDHRPTGERWLVAGIEPTMVGDYLTTPSLVAHLIDTGTPGAVARVAAPAVADGAAAPLNGFFVDAALTASLAALTGNDDFQSATRLFAAANDNNFAAFGLARTPTGASNLDKLDGRVPSQSGLIDRLGDLLRRTHLALVDKRLPGTSTIGELHAKADWAWLALTDSAAKGTVLRTDGRVASAVAPIKDLYPLDMVQDALKSHYQSLLLGGYYWSQTAQKVSDAQSAGIVAAAAVSANWIDLSQNGPDPAPDPAFAPAISTALHAAQQALNRPELDALEVAPAVFNSVSVGSNAAKTTLNVASRVNQIADQVNLTLRNDQGVDQFADFIERETGTGESDDARAFNKALDLTQHATLAEGPYTLSARASTLSGIVSEELSRTFTVDNTRPRVELTPSTTTATGRFSLSGVADDLHLANYQLLWRPSGASQWNATPLASGTQSVPLRTTLASVDSQERGWNGDIEFRLDAADAAGNTSQTSTVVGFTNDWLPPTITLQRHSASQPMASGEALADTVLLDLAVADPTNSGQSAAYGLTSVEMKIESEDVEGSFLQLLSHRWKTNFPAADNVDSIPLDTFALKRNSPQERWRIVVEARDGAGHVATSKVEHLTISNLLWRFVVQPGAFCPGKRADGSYRRTTIVTHFTNPQAESYVEITPLAIPSGQTVAAIRMPQSGTNSGSKEIDWFGERTPGAKDGPYVPVGLYRARVFYRVGTGSYSSADQSVAVVPSIVNPEDFSRLTHLKAREPDGGDVGTEMSVPAGASAEPGSDILLTGQFSELEIHAQLSPAIEPFLDGKGPNPPAWNYPYEDAYWAIEFKSSEAFPTIEDVNGPTTDRGWDNLTRRDNWFPVAWGRDFPAANTSGNNAAGEIVAKLDTSALPEGYYDVRLWTTDGLNIAHHIVSNLKVTKNQDSPDSGVTSSIGAMTLTATDMVVPFTGYSAEISRTYNSNDIYAPSAIGFGWKLNGIAIGIQNYPQGSGEYDEAIIRLPEGREFFFANNPFPGGSGSGVEMNAWAKLGRYTARPYGMNLYRPGGSHQYHWPNEGAVQYVLAGNDTGVKMSPGAPNKPILVKYVDAGGKEYRPGEVAYLQTEDKTWYVFVWLTGDLLEIVKPDGQVTTFEQKNQSEIVIKDIAGRQVKVERATGADPADPNGDQRLITAITDPLGNKVNYEHDKYGNLSAVTDRSGRKRFYIYDTPETKKNPIFASRTDLSGINLHYLIDVRVDDDASGAASFQGDTVSSDPVARLAGTDAAAQNWPGDVSIMNIKYEDGKLRGIETAVGGAEFEHHVSNPGAGGQEIVKDTITGAETIITYDKDRRVTTIKDAFGNTDQNIYDDDEEAIIKGALKQEIDASGNITDYQYADPPGPQHSSFADMFQDYLAGEIGGDLNSSGEVVQPGYLTGMQTRPKNIKQRVNNQNVEFLMSYADDNVAAQFKPTQATDFVGHKVNFTYDLRGNATSNTFVGTDGSIGDKTETDYYDLNETDPITSQVIGANSAILGRVRKITRYPKGNEASIKRSVSYSHRFDGFGPTLTETVTVRNDQDNLTSTVKYDVSGRMTESSDSLGQSRVIQYDAEGRPLYARDNDGNEKWLDYDVFGKIVKERQHLRSVGGKDNINISIHYTYDDAGRVIRTDRRREDGSLIESAKQEYEKPSSGYVKTDIDEWGGKRVTRHDIAGRPVIFEAYDGAGNLKDSTHLEYDELSRVVKSTDARGMVTTNEYDEFSNLTRKTMTGGGSSIEERFEHDAAGRLMKQKKPDGTWIRQVYDPLNRMIKTEKLDAQQNLLATRETKYDAQGRLWATIDEEQYQTGNAYDSQDRISDIYLGAKLDPDHPGQFLSEGLAFELEYDLAGNITKRTLPMSREFICKYKDSNDQRPQYEFGPVCNDANHPLYNKRSVVEYTYDGRGELTKKGWGKANLDQTNIQILRTEEYFNDPYTHKPLEVRYSDGMRLAYRYRNDHPTLIDRIELHDAMPGTIKYWKQYSYDPATWRAAMISTPEGSVSFEYNVLGDMIRMRTSNGVDMRYEYDAMGQVKAVRDASPLKGTGLYKYEYSPTSGRQTAIDYPNGTRIEYAYDAYGFLDRITHKRGATELLEFDYTRDKRGLITGLAEQRDGLPDVTWIYTYDGFKRLKRAVRVESGGDTQTFTYAYDQASNQTAQGYQLNSGSVTTTTCAFNSLDQPTVRNGDHYFYDSFGNLTQEKQDIGGGVLKLARAYSWDGRDRLTLAKVHDPNDNEALLGEIAFGYDMDGALVERREDGQAVRYLNDPRSALGDALAELDATGNQTSRYYVQGRGRLLAQADPAAGGAGSTKFMHGDQIGSARLLTDGSGSVIADSRYDYEPFGKPLGGGGSLTNYRFTGARLETGLGLQRHGARWYASGRSTWLSGDPVFDFPNNFGNTYAYAGQSPISNYDPTGTQSLVETMQTVAIRGYTIYDQYDTAKGVIQLTITVASGGSVGVMEVAFVMASLIPGIPNLGSKLKSLKRGKQLFDNKAVKLFRETMQHYGNRTAANIGEGMMNIIGKTRFKQIKGYIPIKGRNFDNIFREGDDIILGEAKAGKKAIARELDEAAEYSRRTGQFINGSKYAKDKQLQRVKQKFSGKFGEAAEHEQGTLEWITDCAMEMKHSGDAVQAELGEEIMEKLLKTPPQVKWYELRVDLDDAMVPTEVLEEMRTIDDIL